MSDDYRTILVTWINWAEHEGLITEQEHIDIVRDIWSNMETVNA